jgi:non-homologous end joining protein Ku
MPTSYRERALAMIEKKVEGQEFKAVPSAPRRNGQVVDIFAGIKEEPGTAGQQKSTAERGKRKRKA